MGVIAERLRALGLAPRTGVGGTGVVALWDTGKPGRTVLARVDMDALPMPDEKSVPYRSTHEGWNHACGNDGHVAVLLSVAAVCATPATTQLKWTPEDDVAQWTNCITEPREFVLQLVVEDALGGTTSVDRAFTLAFLLF